jgi:hypothetical protein
MPLEELNNLVKIGKIKPEPVSLSEVEDSTILELCSLAEKLIDDVDRLLNRYLEG